MKLQAHHFVAVALAIVGGVVLIFAPAGVAPYGALGLLGAAWAGATN